MSDINERIAKVKEQIIETKIARHHLGLTEYDEIIDDFEFLITTIESQKEEIEGLQRQAIYTAYRVLKKKHEEDAESFIEHIFKIESEIESLKAITELAVKGLQMLKAMSSKEDIPAALYNTASWYLDEIVNLEVKL